MVVDLWYARQPWNGPSRQEVVERVIARAISLVEETRPLLPGVREAVGMQRTRFIGGTGLRVTTTYAGKSVDHV